MSDPAHLLTLQFLTWVRTAPRTYDDVKQGWRSTCPRLATWEDAIEAGLIQFEHGGERLSDRSTVTLTPRGRALLESEAAD
jgi:D-3-phosphoglycerate dehydrogenase